MRTDEFKRLLNNIDDDYIDKAGKALENYRRSNEEYISVVPSSKPFRKAYLAGAVCAAAVLVGAFAVIMNVGRLNKAAESSDPTDSSVSSVVGAENYLGGSGEFRGEYYFEDDGNIYIPIVYEKLLKFNKNTETLSVACQTSGCVHDDDSCKAYLYMKGYTVFNGRLIKTVNEQIQNSDGTYTVKGSLYLCGQDEECVYRFEYPQGIDDSLLPEDKNTAIDLVRALGSDYLMVRKSSWTYIMDKNFTIKHTINDMGSYGGGIYYVDGAVYYIDNLYNLKRFDLSTGESSVVDLGSMKITEGALAGDTLWFSNGDMAICSYDFRTGEVRTLPQKGVRMNLAGKYIEFMDYDDGEVYLLDVESEEIRRWENANINRDDLFYANNRYYVFRNNILTEYDSDLKEIVKQYIIME